MPNGKIAVSAPSGAAFYRIEDILRARQDFIVRAVDRSLMREREQQIRFACDEGSRVSFMGRDVTLRFAEKGSSRMDGDEIVLVLKKIGDAERRKEALKRFAEKTLRAYALAKFEQVHPQFAHAAPMPELKLRIMRARWGSCIPKTAEITLNTRLAFYPTECIDYVIMHEFAHFLHADHSKAFWQALTLHMPDWEQRKKTLNQKPMAQWI